MSDLPAAIDRLLLLVHVEGCACNVPGFDGARTVGVRCGELREGLRREILAGMMEREAFGMERADGLASLDIDRATEKLRACAAAIREGR